MDESFKSLTIDRFGVYPAYGMGSYLDIKKDVPSYKDVQTGIDFMIHFKEKRSSKTEESLIKEVFSFIQKVNEKEIKNIQLMFSLKEKKQESGISETFSIMIPSDKLDTIETEEDVKKFINIF